MKALVAGDELVGEGQPGHQATLLQPENSAETSREEDALNARERHQTLGKGSIAVDQKARLTLELRCVDSEES